VEPGWSLTIKILSRLGPLKWFRDFTFRNARFPGQILKIHGKPAGTFGAVTRGQITPEMHTFRLAEYPRQGKIPQENG
jgi:hypothetical protein